VRRRESVVEEPRQLGLLGLLQKVSRATRHPLKVVVLEFKWDVVVHLHGTDVRAVDAVAHRKAELSAVVSCQVVLLLEERVVLVVRARVVRVDEPRCAEMPLADRAREVAVVLKRRRYRQVALDEVGVPLDADRAARRVLREYVAAARSETAV